MIADIYLRDSKTGMCRIYREPNWTEGSEFYWSEGNFGCDDNRYQALWYLDCPGFPDEIGCTLGPNRIRIDKVVCVETGEILESDMNMGSSAA